MKLFWKLFLSMTTITALLFSIGGFSLIYFNFNSSLQSETQAARTENSLLAYSLVSSIEERLKRDELLGSEGDAFEKLKLAAKELTAMPFRISNEAGVIVYEHRWDHSAEPLIPPESGRGTTVRRDDAQPYILVSSPIRLETKRVYIETSRPVDRLFTERDSLARLCMLMLLCLLLIGGLLIFFVSLGLTRPITRLSRCVRGYARGDFSRRMEKYDNSEIGLLAADFDTMADNLEQMIQELSDAADRQERFVGSFAHELKTPLTSIIGYADMMRSKNLSPEQNALCAGTIFSEGKRLEALSMKLMELLVLKKQDFTLRKIPAEQFFESAAKAVFPLLKRAGVKFSARYEKCPILCEPDLLETLCLNLIDNARKSMGEKSDGRIIFKGERQEGGYLLSVMDNGRGMSDEELTKISEAFYMVDKSRARAQGGAGLGLSICREIAAVHESELHFTSTPNKGTTVSILLKGGT